MKQITELIQYIPLCLLVKLLGVLPFRVTRAVTKSLIMLFYLFDKRHRKVALRNLEIAFPEKSPSEKKEIVKKCYKNLGGVVAEFAHFPNINRDNVLRYTVHSGLENLEESFKKGRGVIVATAHIGNWEMSGFALSVFWNPVYIVARAVKNKLLDSLVNNYRSIHGNTVIEKKLAGIHVIKALKKGGVVGILMDQNTSIKEGGVFVDFFTKKAATTSFIARIAMKYDIPVVPAYLIMNSSYPHTLYFEKPVELSKTGDSDKDLVENVAKMSKVIESVIRKYPDQWFWLHRKWKNRPEGEEEIY